MPARQGPIAAQACTRARPCDEKSPCLPTGARSRRARNLALTVDTPARSLARLLRAEARRGAKPRTPSCRSEARRVKGVHETFCRKPGDGRTPETGSPASAGVHRHSRCSGRASLSSDAPRPVFGGNERGLSRERIVVSVDWYRRDGAGRGADSLRSREASSRGERDDVAHRAARSRRLDGLPRPGIQGPRLLHRGGLRPLVGDAGPVGGGFLLLRRVPVAGGRVLRDEGRHLRQRADGRSGARPRHAHRAPHGARRWCGHGTVRGRPGARGSRRHLRHLP